jgi:hypothetical protein
VVSPDGQAALISVDPAFAPDDERMTPLVEAIRASDLPAGSEITGVAAVSVDIVDLLSGHLWWVIGFVVAMSVLLLMLVFRSLVVPLKAAAMNLLSVSAAFGVLVMLFQWGWGAELLGLPGAVPVSTWVPILMFAVLFGLSMDYEVFMLSRIREDWLQTGDAHGSVVRGLAATGRVITSCALIMVAVFVGFALDSEVTIKMIGVGMATAIAVDATLVRLVLVPATMVLLGEANWWLPRWLDRLLPHLGDPGDGHAVTDAVPEPALALIRTAVRPYPGGVDPPRTGPAGPRHPGAGRAASGARPRQAARPVAARRPDAGSAAARRGAAARVGAVGPGLRGAAARPARDGLRRRRLVRAGRAARDRGARGIRPRCRPRPARTGPRAGSRLVERDRGARRHLRRRRAGTPGRGSAGGGASAGRASPGARCRARRRRRVARSRGRAAGTLGPLGGTGPRARVPLRLPAGGGVVRPRCCEPAPSGAGAAGRRTRVGSPAHPPR